LGKTQFINGVQVKDIGLNAKTVIMAIIWQLSQTNYMSLSKLRKSADVALTKDKKGTFGRYKKIPQNASWAFV